MTDPDYPRLSKASQYRLRKRIAEDDSDTSDPSESEASPTKKLPSSVIPGTESNTDEDEDNSSKSTNSPHPDPAVWEINLPPSDHEQRSEPDDPVEHDAEPSGSSDSSESDSDLSEIEEEFLEEEEYDLHERAEVHDDPPLYAGAPISLSQSILAILTFSLVHHLSGVVLADLLTLISMHCIMRDKRCKDTLYKFRKYFSHIQSPVTLHYYCSNCFKTLTSKDDACEEENCAGKGASFFLQISIISQLSSMFKRVGFIEMLAFRFNRVKKNPNNFEDLYDGSVYCDAVRNGYLSDPSQISFSWNTDGVSIFKSTKLSIWPFYLAINELPYSQRFRTENMVLAGLWFGREKPALPLFVESFYNDLRQLHSGVNFQLPDNPAGVTVKAKVLCGTCDMPAKAHFLNIRQFNGFYGCPNCKQRGERSERTEQQHSYPLEDAELRTDEESKLHAQAAAESNSVVFGIKGPSALSLYIHNNITSTAIDVMHCLFEGVTKKLLLLWFDVEYRQKHFSLYKVLKQVDEMLAYITPPSFIKRMPRSIAEYLPHWKASEYKNWLFYYSIPTLSRVMTPEYLNHHLLLVHGVYLLNQESISEDMVLEAEFCLKQYLLKFQDLYGLRYLTINFHMLLHLGTTVRLFGPLWTMSCMMYEDLNGKLKQFVHGTTHVPSQIANTLTQFVTLPVLISNLDPADSTRQWCEKLLSTHRLNIHEVVSDSIATVGKYVKLPVLPPLIKEALVNAGIDGNVTQFFKLKKKNVTYFSKSYQRATKTLSVCTKFRRGGELCYGLIQTFLKISQCECEKVCLCVGDFYAVVTILQIENPFTIVDPHVTLTYIMACVESPYSEAIAVESLEGVCFCFKSNDSMYIVNPVNTLELE